MANKMKFNYHNRDFESLKNDLQTYIKVYYPEQYNDFSEATVGMMLVELNAYVGDILSYHVDTKFNEVFLKTAVNRSSVIQLAKNLGYKPRGKTGAVTLLNVSMDVPTLGDTYDEDYLITLKSGFKAKGTNGITYQVLEPIDFNSHLSLAGNINRTIVPNYNNSNEIESYKFTKTVAAFAGEIKTARVEITNDRGIPFFKWTPDEDDTSIISIQNVVSTSTRFTPENEVDWTEAGDNLVWYEMDTLAQERVFIDTSTGGTKSEGYWKYTAQRFVTDYDEYGNIWLTFGAGVKDYDNFSTYLLNGISGMTAANLLNNDSLGSIPEPGTYIQCRYKTGGGMNTNIGMNKITQVEYKEVDYIPGGAGVDSAKYASLVQSISVTNPVPAVGGRDFETIEEIKEYAKKHFSSQDRCVTVDDYISRVQLMPSTYGNIFRCYAQADPESMNTALYILTRDETGLLSNSGNDTLKYNLAAYLHQYKILNDFVNIYDGRIINIGINFTLQIDAAYNKREVLVSAIKMLKNHFAVENWQMNETIYISQINELLREMPGVINVVNLEFVNKIGGDYSSDVLAINSSNFNLRDAAYIAQNGEIGITPVNNAIKAPITGMFEIKYPTKDIKGAAL